MLTAIRLLDSPGNLLHQSGVIFISSEHDLEQVPVDSTKTAFVKSQLWEKNKSQVHFSSENSQLVFVKAKDHDSSSYQLEQARKAGAASWKILKETEKPRVLDRKSVV